MKFQRTYVAGVMFLFLFSVAEHSTGRELRPADHGLTFQNTSTATESPDAMSFFGGDISKVPLPEAKNLTDVTWRNNDRRGSGGDGHVRKAWLVASLVCGVTGIGLLSVAAFIFMYRFQMESKQRSSST